MKDRKLAARYARALLSAVTDPRAQVQIDEFLAALAEAIDASAELRAALFDPAVSRRAREGILRSLVEPRGLPPQLGNFFATLVDNNRVAVLPTIAEVFHELREEAQGIVAAELTTASPLSEELQRRAREAIEKRIGRNVRLSCRVEPELLGGAVTRIGSTVYDGSLRSQLGRMRRRMVRG